MRAYVQNLTKELIPRLSSPEMASASDRVRFVLGHESTRQLRGRLEAEQATSTSDKNVEVARRNREDGNAAFQRANYDLALLLYSEALRYSPVHRVTGEGEDLATAAANRSVALFQKKRYRQVFHVINLL